MSLTQFKTLWDTHTPNRTYQMTDASGGLVDAGADGVNLATVNGSPLYAQDGPYDGTKSVLFTRSDSDCIYNASGGIATSDEMTIVVAFKSRTTSAPGAGNYQVLVSSQTAATSKFQFIFRFDGTGGIYGTHYHAASTEGFNIATNVYDGNWHLLGYAGKVSTAAATLVVDGVSVTPGNQSAVSCNDGFFVGSRAAAVYQADAYIAMVGVISGKALTEAQLIALNTAWVAADSDITIGGARDGWRRYHGYVRKGQRF